MSRFLDLGVKLSQTERAEAISQAALEWIMGVRSGRVECYKGCS